MPITPMIFPSDGMLEMLDRYDRIAKRLCSSVDFDAASKTLSLFESRLGGIADSMSPAFSKSFPQDLFAPLSADIVERINATYKTIDFSAFDRLASICDRLDSFSTLCAVPEPYIEDETLAQDISAAISDAKPFMTQAQQQACEEQVAPARTRKLSLSDALAMLSLLVALFSFLVQILPDKQLDTMIEQQQTMIEAEREENDALINAIDSLGVTIGRLSDEIEVLQDRLDAATSPDCEDEKEDLVDLH